MKPEKPPIWPLVLMMIWYAVLLVGAGIVMLIGFSFGSEAYRGAGIPIGELLTFVGPFVLVMGLIISTVWLWFSGKHTIAYIICAVSLLPLALFLFGFGLVL